MFFVFSLHCAMGRWNRKEGVGRVIDGFVDIMFYERRQHGTRNMKMRHISRTNMCCMIYVHIGFGCVASGCGRCRNSMGVNGRYCVMAYGLGSWSYLEFNDIVGMVDGTTNMESSMSK